MGSEGVLFTRLRGLPLTKKELDTEGGREDIWLTVSSRCVCVQVSVNACVYVLEKLQYMCMFIRLLNDPVWGVCFLALTVSPDTRALYLCVHLFV